ncbi:PH domain-containing protein [Nocardioides sp.]|uniref:PH domain-containing protein n=1 Tax=Nocardioides sp. TaxID=35761 RepID=UPI002BE3DCA9|nr:PH domain-containing protein [Nocardioides sp.]HSX66308.1 PH domain-containing protein [Nocardioides sp.]
MSTFPARLLNDGEQVVVSTRTHAKALVLPVLGLLVALVLVAWSFTPGIAEPPKVPDGDNDLGIFHAALRWGARLLALLVLAMALPPFVRWLTTTYTFTTRRFIKRSGLIAKEGRTIPLNRISGVDFEMGVIDRLFGCGTLVVSDASTGGRVELADIPRVEEVQLQVAAELHRLSGDDDGA